MPFKIVETIERGEIKLTTIPDNWEHNGILYWPESAKLEKRRKIENSFPDHKKWKKIDCVVKRRDIPTFYQAEDEIDAMSNNSETETDIENQPPNKIKRLPLRSFNSMAEVASTSSMSFLLNKTQSMDHDQCIAPGKQPINPDTLEKLYKEIKNVFGDSDRDVTDEDIREMPYLDMVFKEVIRLFPSGVMTQRTVNEDIKISKVTLPEGCSIVIPIFFMQRDRRYWKNPDAFDPERFSPENSDPNGCFLPFSLGPMDCIGRYFGIKLVKTVCTKILRVFRLTSPEKYEDLRIELAVSVASVNGFPVQLHPRH